MFEQHSSSLKHKYFFAYAFRHLLQLLQSEMQEPLENAANYGVEVWKILPNTGSGTVQVRILSRLNLHNTSGGKKKMKEENSHYIVI